MSGVVFAPKPITQTRGSTAPKIRRPGVSSIPGTGAGSRVAPAISQQVRPMEQNSAASLEQYRETLQNRIQQGQEHTNQYVSTTNSTRTAMEQARKRQEAERLARKKQLAEQSAFVQGQKSIGGSYSGSTSGGRKPGAWGKYRNGQIPINALGSIAPGHYMREDAAAAFRRMNAAFKQQFGRNIAITSSYRPYSRQVQLKRQKGRLAATPGTSNHGWGLALDLGGGINKWGTAENNWMNQNAAQFGFGPSASAYIRKNEPWHWEYRG